MEFFIPMKPPTATHQQKQTTIRNNRVIYFEPQNVKDARAKYSAYLSKHIPKSIYDGALECHVIWCFPLIKGKLDGDHKATKPDAHNLNKLFFDVMTDLNFWKDDSRVAREIIEKYWASTPGIWVSIEKIENPRRWQSLEKLGVVVPYSG